MNNRRNLNLKRRAAWVAPFLMILVAGVIAVRAQSTAAPYAEFQYSTLTGSGNTITATQVPVVTSTGVTVYENLSLQFNVDANGNLSIATGYPQIVPAPALLASGFLAGTYIGPPTVNSGGMIISVAGPGVTSGGATEWTLSSASGANACTFPYSATWYVGPISSSPLAARLKSNGITSTAWSYGIGTASQCSGANNAWYLNPLIGVSQVGNTITFASFTFQNSDYSTPQAQITYTLKQ